MSTAGAGHRDGSSWAVPSAGRPNHNSMDAGAVDAPTKAEEDDLSPPPFSLSFAFPQPARSSSSFATPEALPAISTSATSSSDSKPGDATSSGPVPAPPANLSLPPPASLHMGAHTITPFGPLTDSSPKPPASLSFPPPPASLSFADIQSTPSSQPSSASKRPLRRPSVANGDAAAATSSASQPSAATKRRRVSPPSQTGAAPAPSSSKSGRRAIESSFELEIPVRPKSSAIKQNGVKKDGTDAPTKVKDEKSDGTPAAALPTRTSSRKSRLRTSLAAEGPGQVAPLVQPDVEDVKGKGKEQVDEMVEPEPTPEQAADLEEAKNGKYGYILQTSYCTSRALANACRHVLPLVSRCQDCTSKQTAYTCAFQSVRSFPLSAPEDQGGEPLPYPVFLDTTAVDDTPELPTSFDRPYTIVEASLLRSACSTYLLPTLQRELAHAIQPNSARTRLALGITHTCDGCAASILCGSWICTTCAREYCLECFDALKTLDQVAVEAVPLWGHSQFLEPIGGLHIGAIEKLTRCVKSRHLPDKVSDTDEKERQIRQGPFVPLTRMDRHELRRLVDEMELWGKQHPLPPPKELPAGWLQLHRFDPGAKENSWPYLRFPGDLLPPKLDGGSPLVLADEQMADFPKEAAEDKVIYPDPTLQAVPPPPPTLNMAKATAALGSTASGSVPSYRSSKLPPALADLSQHDLFRSLWSIGEPLLIDLAPENYPSLPWTPDYFIGQFGNEVCRIGSTRVIANTKEGEREKERNGTVGAFFATFGRERDTGDVEKIKDWPAANDFRSAYPELWQDFMSILPAGSITRRDGVLDIAAHTPRNANPPDLGPKGYFAQASDDRKGGKGTTKLHMVRSDVADAVNIMLWSSDGPDGSPGVAIRRFLYEHIAKKEGLTVDEAIKRFDDPIHTQKFFLDVDMRKQLYKSTGVKSFRIHQRPNQAVFIPAGCAHQVCNKADCIKVATDFVSVENVARCWKVSDEFRQQIKDKFLWRSDVLQLKSMLLWAWRSAERFEPPGGATGETTMNDRLIVAHAGSGDAMDFEA
ncbi:jumonji domain containing protein [Rhodotorula toruloides]|uniref:Jumonji domain containing protein n=1 Tax=Rhodotorula toruloides TaxID=5286 RepID=A0A511KMD2_RHOTO|nr:jumonji domain containing protein [Rhodotorula toruloides]